MGCWTPEGKSEAGDGGTTTVRIGTGDYVDNHDDTDRELAERVRDLEIALYSTLLSLTAALVDPPLTPEQIASVKQIGGLALQRIRPRVARGILDEVK